MGGRGHVLEHEESSRIWRKIAASMGYNVIAEYLGDQVRKTLDPKETPVTRKLVIEHHNMDGVFVDAGANVAEVINNLGTQDCPEVHRHLDELIRVLRKQSARPYRWRVIEEKPAGRPAKRGDTVMVPGEKVWGVVMDGNSAGIGVAFAGDGRNVWRLWHSFPTNLVFTKDGAPVTGYDPS